MTRPLRCCLFVGVLLLLSNPNASFAVDWTEDGGTDNWSDNNNWSSGVPGPLATAVFNPNDGPRTQFVDFDQTATVANLHVQDGSTFGGFSYTNVFTTFDARPNTRLDITNTLRLRGSSSDIDTGRASLTLKQMNVFAQEVELASGGPAGVGEKFLRLIDTQLITDMDSTLTGGKLELIVEEDSLLANAGTGTLRLPSSGHLEMATGGVLDWELDSSSGSQIVIGEGSGRLERASSIRSDVITTAPSSRLVFGDPTGAKSSLTFVSGVIAGPGGVVVDGPNQVLHLQAANTFTGGLRLEQGIASASSGSRLGGLGSFLQFSGGTLRTTGSFTIGIDSFITGVGGIDTVGSNVAVTGDFTGNVSGVFIKSGSGTLTLNNNNSGYSGSYAVEGGTLVSGSGDSFGNRSTVSVGRFGTLRFDGAENFDGLNGVGTVDVNGQNLRLGTNDSVTNDFAGQLIGSGSILMSGSGFQRFSGDNTAYTGTIGFTEDADGVLIFAQVESLGRDIDVPSGTVVQFDLEAGESDHNHAFSGSGIVFVSGAGTLNLNNDSPDFDGAVLVSEGTVNLNGTHTLEEAAVSDGGGLGGDGIINGPVEVFVGSFVNPGRSVGKLTAASYRMRSETVLAVELAGNSGVAGVDHDQLVVTGDAQIDDATLSVSLLDGFAPSHGDEFLILDIGGAIMGTGFTQFDLPEVPGMAWDTSAVLTDGLIAIEVVLPGDYNLDGTVDAADYTVWRDNLGASPGTLASDIDGGVIGEAHYQTWVANFGRSLTATSAAVPEPATSAAVPEPTAALLLVLAAGFGRPLSRRIR